MVHGQLYAMLSGKPHAQSHARRRCGYADHGYGSAVLVAGGGVRGGRYHSRWPTLRDGRLESGDLTVTTDYRHLLMEILQARFPGVDAHRVFPQAGYRRRLGVMR